MRYLIPIFVLMPIVELWLLIKLGSLIGAGWTIALVFATGVVGSWMARREGMKTLWEFQRLSQQGQLPGQAIMDGLAIFAGGALLITPGVVTDLFGFSLLLPPSRRWIQRTVGGWLRKRLQVTQMHATGAPWPGPQQPGQNTDPLVYDQTFDPEDAPDRSEGATQAPSGGGDRGDDA